MFQFGGDEESGGGLVSENRSDSTKSSLSNFIVSENYINKIEQQPSFDNDINLAGQSQKKKGKLNEMFVLRNLKVMVKRDQMRHKTRSIEEKVQLRIARKDPAQRRIQAIKKCFHTVVEKPIMFLLHITIPNSEKEKWRRNFAMVNPPCATLFLLMTSHSKCLSVILSLLIQISSFFQNSMYPIQSNKSASWSVSPLESR